MTLLLELTGAYRVFGSKSSNKPACLTTQLSCTTAIRGSGRTKPPALAVLGFGLYSINLKIKSKP
jgi:hypothetical protein